MNNRSSKLITIGVVSNNGHKNLSNILSSIIPQLNDSVEVIMILDESDSDAMDLINKYHNSNLRFFIEERTNNSLSPIDKVLIESQGVYVLWIDDNSIPLPGLIDSYLSTVSLYNNVDVIYSSMQEYELSDPFYLYVKKCAGFGSNFIKKLLVINDISPFSRLIRRSLYFYSGGNDERFLQIRSLDFCTQISNTARFIEIDKKLCTFKQPMGSTFCNYDCSYISYFVMCALRKVSLEILFPTLNWVDLSRALSQALKLIVKGFIFFGDIYNANKFLKYVRMDHLGIEDIKILLKLRLILGRHHEVICGLASISKISPSFSRQNISLLHYEVNEVLSIETKLKQAYSLNQIHEMLGYFKSIKTKLRLSISIFDIYADRFEKMAMVDRHKRVLESSLRLCPDNNIYLEKLLSIARTEKDKENVMMLKKRMLTDQPDAPSYLIASFCPEL